jgi:hypothetical protein
MIVGAASKWFASTFTGLGLLALAAPSMAANVLTNGNFATGDLTRWTVFQTTYGTTGSSLPAVVSFDTTGAGNSNSAQFNVGVNAHAGFLTPQGGGITQTVDVLGGTYVFSASLATLNDADGQINGDGTFTLLVDGIAHDAVGLGGFTLPFQLVRGNLDGTVVLGAGLHTIGIESRANTFPPAMRRRPSTSRIFP